MQREYWDWRKTMSEMAENQPFRYGYFIAGYNEFDPETEEPRWVIQRINAKGSTQEVDQEWSVERKGEHFICVGQKDKKINFLLQKVARRVERSGV
jgi:hypothetical protein